LKRTTLIRAPELTSDDEYSDGTLIASEYRYLNNREIKHEIFFDKNFINCLRCGESYPDPSYFYNLNNCA